MSRTLRRLIITGLAVFFYTSVFSQRYLSELDSSLFIRDTIRPFLKRFDNIRMTGYIQSQLQLAQSEGAKSYNGGDFSQFSKSRFMLRRARVRIDYFVTTKDKFAKALFTFQVDATERGVNVRDMFLRLYETKHHNFALTTGIFARPFGFEVNLSSAFREAPERGRMSQILMPSERDLGAMVSFEPQDRNNKLRWLKVDAGVFNGQGLSGTTDFDSRKDFISRVTIKPLKISQFELSGGLSLLQGGWRQATKYVFTPGMAANGDKIFTVDSSLSNIGKIAPRKYYGADIQVKLNQGWGETELRIEYWTGKQPGSATSTTNPGSLPNAPVYIRDFNGAFLCFLQNIVNKKHQLLIKYDWYDPDRNVKGNDIGKPGTNLSSTDIRYSTLGIGYIYYFSDYTKLVLYYDIVKNEATQLAGYTGNLKDNIFTCRVQFRF
ncbi:MAG: porin [Chitinophagaceae bacterium]|nr:porin [Chitinophagaceae bacterium]